MKNKSTELQYYLDAPFGSLAGIAAGYLVTKNMTNATITAKIICMAIGFFAGAHFQHAIFDKDRSLETNKGELLQPNKK